MDTLKQLRSGQHFINYIEPINGSITAVILFENRTAKNLLLNKHYISPWQVSLHKSYGYGVITVVPKNQESIEGMTSLIYTLNDLLKSQGIVTNHLLAFKHSCQKAIAFEGQQACQSSLHLFSPSTALLKKISNLKHSNVTLYVDTYYTGEIIDAENIELIPCDGLGNQVYQYFEVTEGFDSVIHKKTVEISTLVNNRVHTGIYQRNYNQKKSKIKEIKLPPPDPKPQWRNSNIKRYEKNLNQYLVDTDSAKIFCIGFHKTGTTSINKALKELGYRIKSHYGTQNQRINQDWLFNAIPLLNGHSAFEDMPWPINFKLWDKMYPNAKFILTVRETKSWYQSVCKYFGDKPTETRKWIYGKNRFNPLTNEKHYITTYESHNQAVIDYFKDKPNKLLVYNLVHGDGWKPLCEFLNREEPDIPFPHSNKTKNS